MTNDAFESAIFKFPGDPGPLGTYADWMEERNNYRDAYALRWMAARRRFPGRRTDVLRKPWVWIPEQERHEHKGVAVKLIRLFPAAAVPHYIFYLMREFDWENFKSFISYPTFATAHCALAAALDDLRRETSLESPP